MDKKLKKDWVTALRSGEYKQGEGQLRKGGPDGDDQFCCLGVLCEVSDEFIRTGGGYKYQIDDDEVPTFYEMTASIEDSIAKKFGLMKKFTHKKEKMFLQSKLIYLNDTEHKNFDQIADYLESVDF